MIWQYSSDHRTCLLYTSDAADELDGVDLGGRRIIKKIKTKNLDNWTIGIRIFGDSDVMNKSQD